MRAENGSRVAEGSHPCDLGNELIAFDRAARRANASPNTLVTYHEAVRQFAAFLLAHDYPTDLAEIRPRHVEEWQIALLDQVEGHDGAQPLPGPATVLPLVCRRGVLR